MCYQDIVQVNDITMIYHSFIHSLTMSIVEDTKKTRPICGKPWMERVD